MTVIKISWPQQRFQTTSFFTLACFFITCLLVQYGCDTPFQPHQENDRYTFSIYGYLDASVDTQWVRIFPARDQLETPPKKPEMKVTLEHLKSGKSAVMEDSLFQFIRPTGFNVINAWTSMGLEPEETYQLKGERPDGKTSNVTVTLPEDFPTPYLEITGDFFDRLYIRGVDRLIDIQSRWFYRIYYGSGNIEDRIIINTYTDRAESSTPGEYSVRINHERDQDRARQQLILPATARAEFLGQQIFVASGGPEWNDEIESIDDMRYALPDVLSNVDSGIGYLVGIVSKSIPYKSCFNEQEEFIACPEEQPLF